VELEQEMCPAKAKTMATGEILWATKHASLERDWKIRMALESSVEGQGLGDD